jgi:NADPH:quinone reductase-like Zn-dependent oxidoreductase
VGYSLHREPEDEISRALPKLNELVKDGLLRPTIDSTVDFEDFEKGYSRLGSRKAVGSITLRFWSEYSVEGYKRSVSADSAEQHPQ